MTGFYRPGQLISNLLYLVKQMGVTPKWFIDCGVGLGSECVDAIRVWPGINVLGLEPSPACFPFLEEHFPKEGKWLKIAAWNKNEEMLLLRDPDTPLHSYCEASDPNEVMGWRVPARTLDSLSNEIGPFDKTILWIDVEGAEERVLRGARDLFRRGSIIAVNIEVRHSNERLLGAILNAHKLKKVSIYSFRGDVHDEVWVQ